LIGSWIIHFEFIQGMGQKDDFCLLLEGDFGLTQKVRGEGERKNLVVNTE
jgi:hypothetical protein